MAEQKYYTIVTDLGAELMAKAAQKGQKVNVVNIAAGDGDGVFYKPTSDMTALKREIWRGKIQNYEIDSVSRNVIKISGTIPKDVGHFTLREMAIFDDNNNMIAVCNAPDLLKAVLEEGALTEAVVYMRIAVTNTEVVNIVVNSSAVYATVQELDAHKNDENAHKNLFDKKVDKTEFTTELNKKVDETDFTTELNKKVDETDFTTELNKKVDKTEFTTKLNNKVDKTEFTTELNKKVDKTEFTTELNKKVDKTEFTTELDKKVDKTKFTGEKIGELLEAAGWQSGGDMTAEEIMEKMISNYNWKENSIALGSYAYQSNTTGHNNVSIGILSLNHNTTGCRNVAIGNNALNRNETGEFNTAIGMSAGYNVSGSYNTLLGAGTDIRETYHHCTLLGEGSTVTGSNQVQLGNTSVTVYAQTAVQTRSDARDKVEIQDTVLGLDFIKKLTPRQFKMNSRELYFEQDKQRDYTAKNDGSKAGKRFHQGFVAQEVKQVIDEMGVDFAGYQDHKINGGQDVLSLGYTEFIAPIVKAIQQQQHIIEHLQQKIELLEQNGKGKM